MLYSEVKMSGYSPANSSTIDVITIMGLSEAPTEVILNDNQLVDDEWKWYNDTMVKS